MLSRKLGASGLLQPSSSEAARCGIEVLQCRLEMCMDASVFPRLAGGLETRLSATRVSHAHNVVAEAAHRAFDTSTRRATRGARFTDVFTAVIQAIDDAMH